MIARVRTNSSPETVADAARPFVPAATGPPCVAGIGWRADTRMQVERKAPFLETEWTDIPDADGWRWGVLARAERLEDDTQLTTAQRFRVGRSEVSERFERNVFVQFDRATVRDVTGLPAPDAGDGTSLTGNFAWTGRWFDRLVQPTRGYGLGRCRQPNVRRTDARCDAGVGGCGPGGRGERRAGPGPLTGRGQTARTGRSRSRTDQEGAATQVDEAL